MLYRISAISIKTNIVIEEHKARSKGQSNTKKDPTIFPHTVMGVTSQNPTVVIVTIPHHIDWKIFSNHGFVGCSKAYTKTEKTINIEKNIENAALYSRL